MAECKRYFWLRLHDDFFDSIRIKKLRKMAGGDTFTIIYLKMQLKAIHTDGFLKYTGLEKDFAEELALDIDEDVDNVRITLAYLQSCGLIETEDNVNFLLPYAVENTGSETASTQRSRECRERMKMLQCNTNATQVQQYCNTSATQVQRRDIDIDIDIDRDIDREKHISHTPVREEKHKYGLYDNVLLTDDEYEKWQKEAPDNFALYIGDLSEYMKSKGTSYKDHLATLRNWKRRDEEKGIVRGQKAQTTKKRYDSKINTDELNNSVNDSWSIIENELSEDGDNK